MSARAKVCTEGTQREAAGVLLARPKRPRCPLPSYSNLAKFAREQNGTALRHTHSASRSWIVLLDPLAHARETVLGFPWCNGAALTKLKLTVCRLWSPAPLT